MAISISIVIATHDRHDTIRKTIQALLRQDFPKSKYEIRVVSDAVNGTKCIVRLIKANSRWPDVKRNIGIENANGSIIAFTDDDVLLDKNWLAEIDELFRRNKKLLGIEGKTIADKNM